MIDFLTQHLPELIMSLVTAGALGLCGWFHQQTINYQKLLKEQEDERVQELIREQIEPLVTELKDIRKYVKDFEKRETAQVNLIISFFSVFISGLGLGSSGTSIFSEAFIAEVQTAL